MELAPEAANGKPILSWRSVVPLWIRGNLAIAALNFSESYDVQVPWPAF